MKERILAGERIARQLVLKHDPSPVRPAAPGGSIEGGSVIRENQGFGRITVRCAMAAEGMELLNGGHRAQSQLKERSVPGSAMSTRFGHPVKSGAIGVRNQISDGGVTHALARRKGVQDGQARVLEIPLKDRATPALTVKLKRAVEGISNEGEASPRPASLVGCKRMNHGGFVGARIHRIQNPASGITALLGDAVQFVPRLDHSGDRTVAFLGEDLAAGPAQGAVRGVEPIEGADARSPGGGGAVKEAVRSENRAPRGCTPASVIEMVDRRECTRRR